MAKNKCFLLDTHVFIQWMIKDHRLKKEVVMILRDPQFQIYLSISSVWEMVIKKKIEKLKLPHDWKETIKDSMFEILPIRLEHAFALETLPLYHKDPFDRMLIAQAQIEGATFITGDEKIWKYDVEVLRA